MHTTGNDPPTKSGSNRPVSLTTLDDQELSDATGAQGTPEVNTRPQNRITDLRRRRAARMPLEPEELEQLREYERQYTKRKKSVHLKGNRADEWEDLAVQQGMSLSSWIQEKVETGLTGFEDATRDLREENQRLREEVAGLRGASGKLAVENSQLRTTNDRLVESLADSTRMALRLKGSTP